MRTVCRTYFHEGTSHMEKKTITLSNMALVHSDYQADRAAAKVDRKASVRPTWPKGEQVSFPFRSLYLSDGYLVCSG